MEGHTHKARKWELDQDRFDRLAAKSHIELRDPSVGVSVHNGTVELVLGTKPFEIGRHLYNGAVMEVSLDWIDGAIAQLKRAKELHRVELNRIAKGLGK